MGKALGMTFKLTDKNNERFIRDSDQLGRNDCHDAVLAGPLCTIKLLHR